MTREGLIEVMARALCVDDGVDPDVVGYDRTGRDFPNWYVVQGTAETVLAAIEAAGVRLVPSETNEAMSDAFYHALNHGYPDHRKDRQSKNQGWTMQSEFIWQAMLAASPYAPPDSP